MTAPEARQQVAGSQDEVVQQGEAPDYPLKVTDTGYSIIGTTTDDGDVAGTIFVDFDRNEADDYWNGYGVLILTGACAGQLRKIENWDWASAEYTVAPAFTAQILAGVDYRLIPVSLSAVAGSEGVLLRQKPGTYELLTFDPAVCPASGTTTANGTPTTVIDASRTEVNDFWNTMALLITSGAWNGQVREITDWDLPTHTFTVAPAFGGQILTGVTYKVLTNLPADIDIVAIEAKLDDPVTGLANLKALVDAVEAKLDARLDVAVSTRAAPGAAMALTPAERLIVQALILTDVTPFPGADIDATISSRAPAATALSTAVWTAIRAGYLDNINNAQLLNIPNLSTLTAARIGYLDNINQVGLLQVTAARACRLDYEKQLSRPQKGTQATTNVLTVVGVAIADAAIPFIVEGYISLDLMQAGDTFLIVEEIRDQDDATYREFARASYSDVQISPMIHFNAKRCQGWRIRIQRTAGSDRNITYQFFTDKGAA